MSDDYPKVNYPDFSSSKCVTSYYVAKLYSVPHDGVVEHLQKIHDSIEQSVADAPERSEFLENHGIFPTVKDGVKYFELNRQGFEWFTLHTMGRRSGKWRSMYMYFMGMEFGKYRPPNIPVEYA